MLDIPGISAPTHPPVLPREFTPCSLPPPWVSVGVELTSTSDEFWPPFPTEVALNDFVPVLLCTGFALKCTTLYFSVICMCMYFHIFLYYIFGRHYRRPCHCWQESRRRAGRGVRGGVSGYCWRAVHTAGGFRIEPDTGHSSSRAVSSAHCLVCFALVGC